MRVLTVEALCVLSSTFSSFTEHSRPLFKDLNIVKLSDIITLQLTVLCISSITNFYLLFLMLFLILLGTYIVKTLGYPAG